MAYFLIWIGVIGLIVDGLILVFATEQLTEVMAGIGAIVNTVMFVGGCIIFAINKLRPSETKAPAPSEPEQGG
jgi:hypothetical protein